MIFELFEWARTLSAGPQGVKASNRACTAGFQF